MQVSDKLDEKVVKIHTYKDLKVWQKSMAIVENIYKLTKNFPKEEMYGITSQMRRAAVAIPANISEGAERNHIKEYIQFLYIAKSSGSELKTLLEISHRLGYIKDDVMRNITEVLSQVLKMLGALILKLKQRSYL